jgi:nucleotide-binding universal stress UspA family protein
VDRLTRQSPVPVLIVKERVRGPYRNIIVATDFSAASRQALQAALEFFPHDPLTVFHAYHPPMAGLTEDPARYAEQYARVADADCSAFLDSVEMSETRRAGLRRLVEQGQPRELIAHYVEDQGVDLVVLGTHGRGALMQMFVGSVARDILWSLPCDALLVRGRRADTTSPASSG